MSVTLPSANNKKMKQMMLLATCVLLAMVFSTAQPLYAHADPADADIRVTGVDHYGPVEAGKQLDVVNVWTTNEVDDEARTANQPICYVEVLRNRTVIAKRLPVNFAEGDQVEAAERSTDNTSGRDHLVQISINSLDTTNLTSYRIRVYSDADGKNLLYDGTLAGVYASLTDENGAEASRELIGMRTVSANEEQRSFAADSTYYKAVRATDSAAETAQTYTLATPSTTDALAAGGDNKTLVFTYKPSDAASITAAVNFVNAETGEVVLTENVPGLSPTNTTVAYRVPTTFETTDNAGATQLWRTISVSKSLTFTYPDELSRTVLCRPMKYHEADKGQPFTAYIQYVVEKQDAQGAKSSEVVLTDTVYVDQKTLYTLPQTFCQSRQTLAGGTEAVTYVLDAEQLDSPVLVLDPTKNEVAGGSATFQVPYTNAVSGDEVVWTVQKKIAAQDAAQQQGEGTFRPIVVDTQTYTVGRDEERPVTFEPIEYEGQTYVPWGPTKKTYTYSANTMPVDTVYYVPEGYAPAGQYDVTVQYVNIATGARIGGYTVPVSSDMRDDIKIGPEPEKVSFEGKEYVRLAGQDAPYYHGYFDEYRTYTIYYRDVNDTAYANTVITRTQVIRNTTVVEGADDDTWRTGLTEGANFSAVGAAPTEAGAGGTEAAPAAEGEAADGLLLNEEGVDTATERIEDNETALASAPEGAGAESGAALTGLSDAQRAGIVGASILALAAVGLAILFFWRRKKRPAQEEEAEIAAEGNDEGTK